MFLPVDMLLYGAVIFLCVQFLSTHVIHKENSKLLLISFDGFRWDYLQRVGRERTPHFHSLIDGGVHPEYVKNAYVTRTFPNHLTIVTGLYEETHGVVDNHMYDPKLNENFTYTPNQMTEAKWWDSGVGALPVWAANQKGGNDRKSGVVYFPSSLVPFEKILPYQSLGQYNQSMPFPDIVDVMMKWLLDDHHPINFGALYFFQPDSLGHEVGPNSPKIANMIENLDSEVIGYLLKRINESERLSSELNIIITSDHGMAEIDAKNVIHIDDYIDPTLYTAISYSPVWHIIPKAGHEDEIYNSFKNITHLHTWRRPDIPDQFHYQHNARILDILVVAEIGWMFQPRAGIQGKDWLYDTGKHGTHGYNNGQPDMHPFFIASGPAFKKGYKRGPINIVDIYPLMCHVLGVAMGTTNGTLANVLDMLEDKPPEAMTTTFVTFLVVVVGASLMTGIFTIAVICQQRRHRPIVRRIRLTDDYISSALNGYDMSKPILGASDDELDL